MEVGLAPVSLKGQADRARDRRASTHDFAARLTHTSNLRCVSNFQLRGYSAQRLTATARKELDLHNSLDDYMYLARSDGQKVEKSQDRWLKALSLILVDAMAAIIL